MYLQLTVGGNVFKYNVVQDGPEKIIFMLRNRSYCITKVNNSYQMHDCLDVTLTTDKDNIS